jgi:alpha-tubulin suppressor-like RCC1 family protein
MLPVVLTALSCGRTGLQDDITTKSSGGDDASRDDAGRCDEAGDDGGPLVAVAVTAGTFHTCALTTEHTVYCWGATLSPCCSLDGSPVCGPDLTPRRVPGLTQVTAISAANQYTCVLLDTGAVECWGDNFYGQFGDGTRRTGSTTPITVSDLADAVLIAGGYGSMCAVVRDGTVSCWGANQRGELGDGTTTDHYKPRPVLGLHGPIAISAGGFDACVLTADGRVWCWGANDVGQIGDGTTVDRSGPTQVQGLPAPAIAVATAPSFSCALLEGGEEYCWGANGPSGLGDGTTAQHTTPVHVMLPARATASSHPPGCTIVEGGGMYCWGYGFVGDGTSLTRLEPVLIAGAGQASAIAIGAPNTAHCALLQGGNIDCWGGNSAGELGDGTMTDHPSPLPVRRFGR